MIQPADNPIFCALDTVDIEAAAALAREIAPHVGGVKLGLEFFYAHGAAGVRRIAECGLPIFLDLKLHDIPNTVAGGLRALGALNVAIVNVHTQGGPAMMRAAAEAVAAWPRPALLVGVTVLTSLDAEDLGAIGVASAPEDQVVRLARLAEGAGLGGAVCSPREISALRAACGADFKLVVPGLRPADGALQDQKRIATPQAAYADGADVLVIGRPITGAADPAAAADAIFRSLTRRAA